MYTARPPSLVRQFSLLYPHLLSQTAGMPFGAFSVAFALGFRAGPRSLHDHDQRRRPDRSATVLGTGRLPARRQPGVSQHGLLTASRIVVCRRHGVPEYTSLARDRAARLRLHDCGEFVPISVCGIRASSCMFAYRNLNLYGNLSPTPSLRISRGGARSDDWFCGEGAFSPRAAHSDQCHHVFAEHYKTARPRKSSEPSPTGKREAAPIHRDK